MPCCSTTWTISHRLSIDQVSINDHVYHTGIESILFLYPWQFVNSSVRHETTVLTSDSLRHYRSCEFVYENINSTFPFDCQRRKLAENSSCTAFDFKIQIHGIVFPIHAPSNQRRVHFSALVRCTGNKMRKYTHYIHYTRRVQSNIITRRLEIAANTSENASPQNTYAWTWDTHTHTHQQEDDLFTRIVKNCVDAARFQLFARDYNTYIYIHVCVRVYITMYPNAS